MSKLMKDLEERWRPSEAQIDAAEEQLKTGVEQVFSAHVLINKVWGFWTLDVRLEYLDGIYTDRYEAMKAANKAAEEMERNLGEPCIGGWALHRAERSWAVWDCF